jgi:hypothetical protein
MYNLLNRQHTTFNAPVSIYPEGLAFFARFLEGHHDGAFVSGCDQDLALTTSSSTVRIRDLNLNLRFQANWWLRLHLSPGLRFACCRRYRGASCDVDDAAPLVTEEGRWAATSMG